MSFFTPSCRLRSGKRMGCTELKGGGQSSMFFSISSEHITCWQEPMACFVMQGYP